MVKNKSSEFTLFDDFGYSEEELEKYGGEYIEKQSCILFSAKEKKWSSYLSRGSEYKHF